MNNEQTEKLLKLVSENPELPIIPFVWYEICADDSGYWLGKFGECYVGEYALYGERYFEEREELIDWYLSVNSKELEDFSVDEAVKIAEDKTRLLWKKAILVYIELPD